MKGKYMISKVLVILISFLFIMGYGWAAGNTFRLPGFETFVMKNGLTVYLMEQHEVPLIYVSAVVPAGAVKDGKKYGLASLTADALLFGTRSCTKNQIEEKLDFLGVDYGTRANVEVTEISASFAKKDQDTVMPILKEIIADPVFDQTEFDKRKKRLLLQLERAKERPGAVIRSYYNTFLFGQHGYGNPIDGTRPSVSKMIIEDIKNFYKANYKPAESAIAIVGDFKTPEMKEKVNKWFKGWNAKGSSRPMEAKPLPSFGKSRVLLVNKEDATETRFFIGGPGIKRSNPDYVAIQVINTILGGRFTSWLNDALRVNAGLTYGAYSFFPAYKTSGTFIIGSFTRTPKTVEALDLALEVLERLHKKGIDEKTLESAKNYIKGQYPPRYETAGALANLLTDMFIYDFDESFINDFQKNVDRMTIKKAEEIVKKYFLRENLQFVLIGKASEIRDKVKKYGEVTEKEITAEGF
jgi:predicted Zn-dependent peptidase